MKKKETTPTPRFTHAGYAQDENDEANPHHKRRSVLSIEFDAMERNGYRVRKFKARLEGNVLWSCAVALGFALAIAINNITG